MAYFLPILFNFVLVRYISCATKFDNSVIGYPLVFCEDKDIRIELETLQPFHGKIFVKGEYFNSRCSQSYVNGKKSEPKNYEHEILLQKSSKQSDSSIVVNNTNENDPNLAQKEAFESDNSVADSRENVKRNWNWTGTGGSTTHKKLSRMPFPSAFGGIQDEVNQDQTEPSRVLSQIKVFPKSFNIESLAENSKHSSSVPVCPPCSCEHADIRNRRNTNQLTFTVPIGDCNTKRERILVPSSLITSFVIIVSFHESFITKLDRAYHIQCAYKESSRPVLAGLNVSMSVPSSINSTVQPPKCVYSIIDTSGRNVQDVRVGDLVRHQWKCHTNEPEQYRMLVHDCYVESGLKEKYKIIDDHGCALDKYTFTTPKYLDNLTVSVDSYMFKFPDKAFMDFQCAIKLCSIHAEECVAETTVMCDNRTRRRRNTVIANDYAVLYSNSLTVLDRINVERSNESNYLKMLLSYGVAETCLSISQFGLLIVSTTFFSTISLTFIVAQMILKTK